MPCLTKSQLKQVSLRPPLKVETPEWGADSYVWIRTASGADRDALEGAMVQLGDQRLQNIRARVCLWCTVDDAGQPIFGNEDLVWLGEQDAIVLDRVFEANARHNGMFKGAVEAAAKNSGSGPSAASPSDSPPSSAAA